MQMFVVFATDLQRCEEFCEITSKLCMWIRVNLG